MQELFVTKQNRRLRCGYTTGTCAAAAAYAAVWMMLTGEALRAVPVHTPKGVELSILVERVPDAHDVAFAVTKDSGDDPDVTDGICVVARVRKTAHGVSVDGGTGVGRVTKQGLACAVGSAAINPVPMRMIEQSVREACEACGYHGGVAVEICVPRGEEIAQKTFNPRLGIVGGISILGTSGIVEPMSERALIDTVRLDLKVLRESGASGVLLTPGNYGKDFLKQMGRVAPCYVVKCSNFIGEALDGAAELEFDRVLLVGHIGKFVKLAGGIMNTHSRCADARMELIAAYAAAEGMRDVEPILRCVTTDEAIGMLDACEMRERVMRRLVERMRFHARTRLEGKACEVIVYSNAHGLLGSTEDAEALIQTMGENT